MAEQLEAREALGRVDPLLRELANRLATAQAPADDLWQEGRVALMLALPRFDPTRARLTSFALKYGRMAMVRYLRDRTALIRKPAWRWEQGDREDSCRASLATRRTREPWHDPRAEVDSSLYVEQLLAAVRPSWRVVVRMRMDGWTDTEIGAALGVDMFTVWRRRKRAAKAICRLLDRC